MLFYTSQLKCHYTPVRVDTLADQYDSIVLHSEQQVMNRRPVILELPIHKICEVIEFYYRTYAEVYRFVQCFVNTSESHCKWGLAEE